MPILSSVAGGLAAAGRYLSGGTAANVGTAAVGGGTTAKQIFDYNQGNFLVDREQRLKKELFERKLRVRHANLWREDVRDFISLTEQKMKYYLLVNVLLLGFNVTLWCEGRLPENVPAWLMMGSQVATAGSFLFLLLTVWLSMHAAVSAQSYQVRILTQLVRLPLPTWAELEACRTYASEFELLQPRQVFRVPFVSGSQEKIIQSAYGATSDGGADAGAMAADPWGLERRGDYVYELGTHHGKDVAKLRHIKLVRQAAVYWQTYDAFARVSMSIGVNQLMLAMSYYVLGYVLCQVRCPVAAFAGVLCLTGTAEVIARIDLTLHLFQQRIIQLLLLLGPTISSVAAWQWGLEYEVSAFIAESLAPLAFLSHGVVLGLLTFSLRVSEQQNGAMVPLAFQGVLYNDVFGWLHEKKPKKSDADAAAQVAAAAGIDADQSSPSVAAAATSTPSLNRDTRASIAISARESASTRRNLRTADKPAVASVAHNEVGLPVPTRPDDLRPNGAAQDMRHYPGAPRMWETVSAVAPPGKEFFEPITFMPPADRTRHDSIVDDGEKLHIQTGHDNEKPGLMPWIVFKRSAMLLVSTWFVAALFALLTVTQQNPWWVIQPIEQLGQVEQSRLVTRRLMTPVAEHYSGLMSQVVPRPSVISLWAAVLSGAPIGPTPEQIDVKWPYPGIVPHGLSCDASGKRFLVTDGVSTFTAEMETVSAIPIHGKRLRSSRRMFGMSTELNRGTIGGINASHGTPDVGAATSMRVGFSEVKNCIALHGEAALDTALQCSAENKFPSSCKAIVLHRRGQRVAVCALNENLPAAAGADKAYTISQAWLTKRLKPNQTGHPEEVSWMLVDQTCSNADSEVSARADCPAVGTSNGRILKLDQVEADVTGVFAPSDVLLENRNDVKRTGVVRFFNKRYAGVLQAKRMSIHVLDLDSGGDDAGTLLLPEAPHAKSGTAEVQGFCTGGGYVYLLGKGQSPPLWRVALPHGLWPS